MAGVVPIFHVGADAQQRYEMSACRRAPDANAVRVEVVFLRVGAQVADSSLAVLDLGGERRMLTEPIVDRCGGIAVLEQSQRRSAAVLVTDRPGAAVNPHDQRERPLPFRDVNVELVALVRTIFEVALDPGPLRQLSSFFLLLDFLLLLGRLLRGEVSGCDEQTGQQDQQPAGGETLYR